MFLLCFHSFTFEIALEGENLNCQVKTGLLNNKGPEGLKHVSYSVVDTNSVIHTKTRVTCNTEHEA